MAGAPTHRITYTPQGGAPLIREIRLIAYDFTRRFYSDKQWTDKAEVWAWTYGNDGSNKGPMNGWNCSGGPTPHFKAGTVRIEPLQPAWEPTRTAYRYGGAPKGGLVVIP